MLFELQLKQPQQQTNNKQNNNINQTGLRRDCNWFKLGICCAINPSLFANYAHYIYRNI